MRNNSLMRDLYSPYIGDLHQKTRFGMVLVWLKHFVLTDQKHTHDLDFVHFDLTTIRLMYIFAIYRHTQTDNDFFFIRPMHAVC